MRKPERHLVISFSAAIMAMRMEKFCREYEMPGRLIPLPPVIAAGCGLAWMTDVSTDVNWVKFMQEHEVRYEQMREVEI